LPAPSVLMINRQDQTQFWSARSPSATMRPRIGRVLVCGLARAVSDNATICYLLDVLVRPDEQGNGVGRALVQAVLDL
jgi:hypothetical protein